MRKIPRSVMSLTNEQVLSMIENLPPDMLELPIELQAYCKFLAAAVMGIDQTMGVSKIKRKEQEYYSRAKKDQVSFTEAVRSVLIQVLLYTATKRSVESENDEAASAVLTILTLAIHHNEYVANHHNEYEFVPDVDDHPLAEGIREYLRKQYPALKSWNQRNL